jgi:hypothetical protein
MKSRTEIKRDVVQTGGTIDDAYSIIELRDKVAAFLRAVADNDGALIFKMDTEECRTFVGLRNYMGLVHLGTRSKE